MDNNRKSCPNCCQLFILKYQSSSLKGNLPLFLPCGHTICENCIRSLTKFQEPIECKICHHSTEIKSEHILTLALDKANLFQIFPVNYQILGELTLQLMENNNIKLQLPVEECFIDIQDILMQEDNTKDKCVECNNLTSKMCKQCDTTLCDTCFNKSHKNFVIFKNHALLKIAAPLLESNNNCKVHDDKQLDYYCTDCSKAVCMDCLLVGSDKSCKDHNLKSTSEINDSHIEQIVNIQPKVDETFRRLSKTAVDIGQLLYNIENETGSTSGTTQIIADIEQHFSKLCLLVQKHKEETIEMATKVKSAEKESLIKAKNDVFEALKQAKRTMKMISSTVDTTVFKQMNLSALLEDAKKITQTPWYLLKEEDKNSALKLIVNEDVTGLISDYIRLEGNATSVYKLRTPEELGNDVDIPPPPLTPVLPPQMPRDVRQLKKPKETPVKKTEEVQKSMTFFKDVPSFRSKSTSVNSLNSCSSDSSKTSYIQSDGYQYVPRITPFKQNEQTKQPLIEGSQELVYMSHIVNPHNFYVQRASDQKLVKNVLREYRNAVSEPKPLLCNIVEGKIYLAYNKADNLWQRCRVLSVDKNDPNHAKFIVYCFDFGSIEAVSINNLRLLPAAKWNSPPALAFNCSLANCEPINGEWTNDDSILLQHILDNKQSIINVRRLTYTTEGNIKLECDVTTFEEKVSLAHALVFHDRAKMPNPKLKYPIIKRVEEKPRIFSSNSDFKPKTTDEIYFTYIVSPDIFYVRKRQHQRDFYQICDELNQEYSLNLDAGKIYLPEIGMACVVNTEKFRNTIECSGIMGEDSIWARCVVTEIGLRGRIRVKLVDSGSHLFVPWNMLRAIQPRFTTLRALATECHLAGVTALNKKWSPASVALLKKYQNTILEMQVDNRSRGSIGVTLFDKTDLENVVCINNEMVKYKFAITFGIFNFTRNHDLEDQAFTYKSPLEKPKETKPKPDTIKILKKDSPKIDLEKDSLKEDLAAKDKGPLRLEAKILNYISPSVIYLSLVHQQKMFNDMFENMQKYYSNGKSVGKAEWHVGERCSTICIQSQTWRRAAILELEGENAKVFYSDFASVETVPISTLKELSSEFVSIGVAAIKCHLCGVMPAIGDEWPSITKEFLKELLDAYNRVFITKLGNFKDNSMPIEIWVYHTVQGGALEPDNSEWRCLNKKIIEQGLGIPIKSEQTNIDDNEGIEVEGEEMLSFLNVTGSVRDWLQLEVMPTKPLLIKTESVSDSSTPVECEDSAESEIIDFKTPNNIFVSEWLEPEPFRNDEFMACATFVDNDGIIYLHDVENEGTFDLIRNALSVRYHNPDPKAKYMKWTIGEPCVALYHYDNSFYRGRVVEVNDITANCLVHYIDYGNEEICSFTNMRKSIALHQISTQAHKCVFSRILPAGKQWERQTLDYVHKLIVEKQCYVKVAGKTIDGITPIDMKYDKLWINDHLVDFELARYTDDSKVEHEKVSKSVENKVTNNKEDLLISAAVDVDSPDSIVVENESDFILEDDNNSVISSDANDSFDLATLKGKDWNCIVAEDDENNFITEKYITYPKQPDNEFKCNLAIINDLNIFPLSIIHDAETSMLYDEMFHEIQEEGENMRPLNGIFKNKACVALFEEDKKWYRALIMEHSEIENRIRVRYVDYGNVELISLADAREIHEEWTSLPPLTVAAKLHGIYVNPEMDVDLISKEFSEVLLDKGPFHAKIINNGEFIPTVVLTNSNNELAYKILLEKGVFIKTESKD